MSGVEKRIDADDGKAYTYDEMAAFYKGKYNKKQIEAYWNECKPVARKGKGAGRTRAEKPAATDAKAKAKVKPSGGREERGDRERPARRSAPPAGVGETRSLKPVDVSSLTRIVKDDLGLLAQPERPKFKTALVGIYVRSQPFGGSDKSSNGHRYDAVSIANGMISAGLSCQLVTYVHEEHDKFFEVMKNFDAIIVRCNPGHIKADGGDQNKFDDGMRALRKLGIEVWPSPDVMEFMGAKDALVKISTLTIGLEDTAAYYTPEEFAIGFKKTMAFQPRVIKQNRGSSGEGIWIIKLKSGDYCKNYGDRSVEDSEVLDLMEASDNHAEEHTVAEFIEWCVNGRTDKSGTWTSKGVGKYLEGGKAAGGQLVDQRFCPRIVEGELRYNLVGDELVGIIHKKPKEGGISAVGGTGSIYTYYGPKEKKFATLTKNFLTTDLPKVMPALGLQGEPIPLWWTTDFINSSPAGTPEKDEKWIVGEFNCSCVGISKCGAAYCTEEKPNACFTDISKADLAEARKYCDLMGKKGLNILEKLSKSSGKTAKAGEFNSNGPVDVSALKKAVKDDLGLLEQPVKPKFKTALVGIFVRNQPFGGSDKSSNGHRYDSIPIANGLINNGISCQLIQYIHEDHDKFFEVAKNFDALVVRCNPGQIKADGGDQNKFDDGMRALRKLGIQVWPSPDVMEFMGAKDALVKIAHLTIGLEDTLAYYTPEEFAAGFKKTVAFQPRVIKQNRGSSGEGIWIIKLKAGNYGKTYGERIAEDSEVLDLMEANDNHSEEHTVAEFIEFCVNGRTAKSGEWTSKGVGKYLEGGKAAGGQLVDQRFCPRIVEGELRYNLVGDELYGIIHKKPKEGGISAVGGTGSIYTYYKPKEKKFATLTKKFLGSDLPKILPSLGLSGEPIPLWWTTDFINSSAPGTPEKDEKWIVGEFNCSCVGISKCGEAYCTEEKPDQDYDKISDKDKKEVSALGNLIGKKALGILSKGVIELGYWSIRALGAPIRMMLAYASIEVKETRITSVEHWQKEVKPKLVGSNPLVNLPYLVKNGEVITQSNAVLLAVAQICRLSGGRGKSQNNLLTLLLDVYDLRDLHVNYAYWYKNITRTVSEFNSGKDDYCTKASAFFDKYELYLKREGSPFFLGSRVTAPDFHIWEMLDVHELFFKDLKKESPTASRPALKAFYERFRALPQLANYFASEAYALPVNVPSMAFWSGPGSSMPADAPK